MVTEAVKVGVGKAAGLAHQAAKSEAALRAVAVRVMVARRATEGGGGVAAPAALTGGGSREAKVVGMGAAQ